MSNQAPQDDTRQPSAGESIAEPLVQMIQGLGDTVRREVEQLRTEATQRATGGAKGAGLLIAAGATGTVAAAAAASLPLMALRRVLPGWILALGLAGGAGALATVLAKRGLDELGAATPVDTERIKHAAKEAVRSVA